MSSNLGAVIRTGIFPPIIPKWRMIISWVHKIRLHGRRGKGTAECHLIYSGRQTCGRTSRVNTGRSHRISKSLLRCLLYFLSRERFSSPFTSSTVKSNFMYLRINRTCAKIRTRPDVRRIRGYQLNHRGDRLVFVFLVAWSVNGKRTMKQTRITQDLSQ